MARLGFADRDDLVQWGQSQGASADLPDLVRQLILETTPGVVSLGFATGAGVYGSGWDGTAKATPGGLNVPAGLSLWELSTRSDVNVKADEDFDKRRTTPDGTPTTNATYVALSTRTWQGRGEWANAKRTVGRWRSVEALGVDDLDTWLQGAPVTHAWLSEKLGLQPHGLKTTQAWWDAFIHATEPALPAKLLLAGRDEVAEAVRQKLAGPGQLITISGASRDDVLAFLAALAVSAVDFDGSDGTRTRDLRPNEPAVTGYDRLRPGRACVARVWSAWCLLRQRRHFRGTLRLAGVGWARADPGFVGADPWTERLPGQPLQPHGSLLRELEVVAGVVLDRADGRNREPLIGRTRLARVEVGADQGLRSRKAAVREEHLVFDAWDVGAGNDVRHRRPPGRRAVVVASDEDQRVAVPARLLRLGERPVTRPAGDADERRRRGGRRNERTNRDQDWTHGSVSFRCHPASSSRPLTLQHYAHWAAALPGSP